MDIIRRRFTPQSTSPGAVSLPDSSITQQRWQAVRRLAVWRPMVSAETLLILACLAFSVFYNQAFWHALFG